MQNNEPKELAEKICELTGFGQPLHPNDIIPDIKTLLAEHRNKVLEEAKEVVAGMEQSIDEKLYNWDGYPKSDKQAKEVVENVIEAIDKLKNK